MQHYRYDDEHGGGENEPLDNQNYYYDRSPSRPQYNRQPSQPQQYQQRPQQYRQDSYGRQEQDPYAPSPTRARPPQATGADAAFERARQQRRLSREGQTPYQSPGGPSNYRQPEPVSPISLRQQPPPRAPPHRQQQQPYAEEGQGQYWDQQDRRGGYDRQIPLSNVTPGADNFSEAAAGGMAGIAYSVAERNARESGLEAMRGAPNYPQQAYTQQGQWQNQGQGREHDWERDAQQSRGRDHGPPQGQGLYAANPFMDASGSQSSFASGASGPGHRTPSRSPHGFGAPEHVYTDDPYQGFQPRHQQINIGMVNPEEIQDDDDDGLAYNQSGRNRRSLISLGSGSNHRGRDAAVAGAAAGGAVAGGVLAGAATRGGGTSGSYNAVQNTAYESGGGAGGPGGLEKSEWLDRQSHSSKKWKWLGIIAAVVIVIAGVVCGVLFGVVFKRNSSSSNGANNHSGTAASDSAANGDLDINSAEIQGLLNNKNLHKVFPGVDYTPYNTQYPDCLQNPPSQNNVTRDVAVLSQLTNTIRLYGTDCNQTEMTIHAINQLKMQDTVKIWLGVWQDNNATTNARQLAQMWTILDTYGAKPFKGLIIANEILFRQQMTLTTLGSLLSSVRTNLTAKGMSLPVATSDLGDNWTAELAAQSDYVMSNIHPFFAGKNANTEAAGWTWDFWHNNNAALKDAAHNIIAETGWPSQGGTDCGTDTVTNCPQAAVAGIDQMNQFMNGWVCQALTNGTQYFWFEAFDEPWKISFDTAGKEWEDHWGLMDVDRNLKDGVQIPDCGGKTVD